MLDKIVSWLLLEIYGAAGEFINITLYVYTIQLILNISKYYIIKFI